MTVEVRLRTAVHESGHAVIAETFGLTVVDILVQGDHTAATAIEEQHPELHEAHVRVALAGYAAVGVLLGADTEQQNREDEPHPDGLTDTERARQHAAQAGIRDIDAYLTIVDNEVRALIATMKVEGAIRAITDEIWGHMRDQIFGHEVRQIMRSAAERAQGQGM